MSPRSRSGTAAPSSTAGDADDAPTGESADLTAIRRRFFDATTYDQLPGGAKKLDVLLALLLPHLERAAEFRVLDVGCGNGGLSHPPAALGFPVTGVDVDPESVEHAARTNRYPSARFLRVEGDDFSLDETFDLVICSEVLEHLDEPSGLARTLAAHLAPDGAVLVTVPNGYGPREVLGRTEAFLRRRLALGPAVEGLRRALGMIPADEKCEMYTSNPDQEHVQKFTFRELSDLLADAGIPVREAVNSFLIFSVFFKSGGDGRSIVERLDGGIADLLPRALVSGWYVVAGRRPELGETFRRHYRRVVER